MSPDDLPGGANTAIPYRYLLAASAGSAGVVIGLAVAERFPEFPCGWASSAPRPPLWRWKHGGVAHTRPRATLRSRSVAQPAGGGPQCARESLLAEAGPAHATRRCSTSCEPPRRARERTARTVSWRVSGSSLIESTMPSSWLGELVGGPVSGARWCHAVQWTPSCHSPRCASWPGERWPSRRGLIASS